MSKNKLSAVLDHLRRIADPLAMASSDDDLLARFLGSRDEAAFAALLRRHGPMVYGVSRRYLHQVQDAEDVVQATFLLLARNAATIRKRASLGCWLHGVAQRLSVQLKRRDMNRRTREKQVSASRGQSSVPHPGSQEIQGILDTALQEVSEKYRAALILYYLEGKTQEEAARQMGCPLGTVQSRLTRGRKMLQKQLAKQGWALSTASLATFLMAETARAALPSKLFGASLHASMSYASCQSLTSLVSASVALLVNNGLKSLALTKMIWVSTAVVTFGLLSGAGLVAWGFQDGKVETPKAPVVVAEKKVPEPEVNKPRVDRQGDPLPEGAVARLGTVRFRHGEEIKNLRFSPDGKTLLSADWHGVHVWDASTGRQLRRFGAPRDRWQFDSIATSADCRVVALSMQDGKGQASDVEIWDAVAPKLIRQFKADRFVQVDLSPDGKVVAVLNPPGEKKDYSCRLFDVVTGEERFRLKGYEIVTFSSDSKTLIASVPGKYLRFHDVVTGKQVREIDCLIANVTQIAIAPDGKTMALLAGTKIALWDLAAGKQNCVLEGPILYAPTFSPDSKILVVNDFLKTTFCWDVATGKPLPKLSLPVWGVHAMAFTPDGKTLAMAGIQRTIQLWDLTKGEEKSLTGEPDAPLGPVAMSPDGRLVASGGRDKWIRLWDALSGKENGRFVGHENLTMSLAFAQGGQTLVSSGVDDMTGRQTSIAIWDPAKGKLVRRIPNVVIYGRSTVSQDGKRIVALSGEGFILVWDISSAQELQKWPANKNMHLAFSADANLVFTYDTENKVHIWEVATGKELRQFKGHDFKADSSLDDRIRSIAFSPDGKFVAFGGELHHQVALYDMATAKMIRLIQVLPRTGGGALPAFSADSRILASGDGKTGTVYLWEMETGQGFQQFEGHKGGVSDMAFSADGKQLISGSSDTTALIWDLTGTITNPKAKPLTPNELETAWTDLSAPEAVRGQKAVHTLLAVPDQAQSVLSQKLKPASLPSADKMTQLIADLDSETFQVREKAMRALEKLGDAAAPNVRQALDGKVTLEHKVRLEKLLKTYTESQSLGVIRAVQVLEMLGTTSSRELLMRLADGAPGALITREAKAAVDRLAKLRVAMP